MSIPQSTFLRRALVFDAAVSGATAALLITTAGLMARMLSLPETLLRYAGFVLVPFVILVAFVARQPSVPRSAVVFIIVLNVAWVVASIWLAIVGPVNPNALGTTFIIGQALAVALFAELQYVGLRREGQSAAHRREALGS
jgi:hypothetical protein